MNGSEGGADALTVGQNREKCTGVGFRRTRSTIKAQVNRKFNNGDGFCMNFEKIARFRQRVRLGIRDGG